MLDNINDDTSVRFYGAQFDAEDGHPQTFGEGTTWGLVDNAAGGVVEYGSESAITELANTLNVMLARGEKVTPFGF